MVDVILVTCTTASAMKRRMVENPESIICNPRGRVLARGGVMVNISPVPMRFVLSLIVRDGCVINRDEMIDILYGERPDGGPDDAYKCLDQFLMIARAAAAALGYVVEVVHGSGFRARKVLRTQGRAA